MALVMVVHEPLSVNGNNYNRGDRVASPDDVKEINANPLLRQKVTMSEHSDFEPERGA